MFNQNKEINNFYQRLAHSLNFKKANEQLSNYIEAVNFAKNLADEITLTLEEDSIDNNVLTGELLEYKELLNKKYKEIIQIIKEMTSELNMIQQENPGSLAYSRYLGKLDAYKNWIYDNASLFVKVFLSRYHKLLEQENNNYINEF